MKFISKTKFSIQAKFFQQILIISSEHMNGSNLKNFGLIECKIFVFKVKKLSLCCHLVYIN